MRAGVAFDWAGRLWTESVGPFHSFVGASTAYAGWCHLQQGEFSEAAAKYERALDIAVRVQGATGTRAVQLRADLDWIRRRLDGDLELGSPPGAPDRQPVDWS